MINLFEVFIPEGYARSTLSYVQDMRQINKWHFSLGWYWESTLTIIKYGDQGDDLLVTQLVVFRLLKYIYEDEE